MLIWTFPVLFVATMGSLYHHLGKNLDENVLQRSNNNFSYFTYFKRKIKNPVLMVISFLDSDETATTKNIG